MNISSNTRNTYQIHVLTIMMTFQEAPVINVYHERPRMMEPQKYLGESCYHCIECTAATFLAAFMLTRPLNSVALTITTHRKTREAV